VAPINQSYETFGRYLNIGDSNRAVRGRSFVALLGAWLHVVAVPMGFAGSIVDGAAIADETQGIDWLSTGRTYAEGHYSPLDQINENNVNQLGLAWFLDLPAQGSLQATPLAVDGALYFSGSNGAVFAVDARDGHIVWQFDPDLIHHFPDSKSVLYGGNRGVAYWLGKVYVGTVDGRLVALDAKTGQIAWSVQTFDDTDARKLISGAPRVFNGKVIIGHGGEAGTRGYVTAYDAENGRQRWRFYTVPGDPAKGFENAAMARAAKTWSGQWWKSGGNGTVWDSIVYDPDFNRIYIGTANGTPGNADVRSPGHGDNLFVASIVALDADTGHYVWHYQVNPRDSWDYDATDQMTLADLKIDGKSRKVLMQAPKNGFFYVIDRHTGRLVSAQKYAKATWATRVDLRTGRPIETADAHYEHGPVAVWPSAAGAHDWQSMSFNPITGLVYIPTQKLGMLIGNKSWDLAPRDSDDGTGALLAWDPVAQKRRWEFHFDTFWNGGTMTTAGNLVFMGTGRGQLAAFNAATGEKLWSFYAGLGINAAPITYVVDGIQYISVLVGYGGSPNYFAKVANYGWHFNEQPRRLLTFALGKQIPLPIGTPPRFTILAVDDATLAISATQAKSGAKVYALRACARCHGLNLENAASFAPDLRESTAAVDWNAFSAVVREGALVAEGMPRFDDLTDDELRALYMYVRQQARDATRLPQ
jgi:quinohemoprotein ethanol dehydrogenase